MDTYKRALKGRQSRASGEIFEQMIVAASRFYEEKGIAAVDKTPEAFKSAETFGQKQRSVYMLFYKAGTAGFQRSAHGFNHDSVRCKAYR